MEEKLRAWSSETREDEVGIGHAVQKAKETISFSNLLDKAPHLL